MAFKEIFQSVKYFKLSARSSPIALLKIFKDVKKLIPFLALTDVVR